MFLDKEQEKSVCFRKEVGKKRKNLEVMAKQGHCSHFLRIHVVEKTVLLNNPVNSHKTVKLRTT